ncbi:MULTISPECIES: cold shock domain-containing protein [unclassified Acinetobacter]|uniref:cold shock domain-containing protein n=1 Tax=unclassified Acinetobacter TaxID=196816 RepID=UPI002446AE78|nr:MULTISPECIES: cold shock domain-containing protein [unclassified Acinetobacter]MDH0030840.1 cold shock domain-containing protein [Acinetobacter sp. GD04021]MDH0886387.1 cold shock domain-containing protein [Acinetobacter sp. GD03873]MDH1082863.1 cold shock domain-containing protein [Acinetobacter sp. GD03983]MDH2189889.1 cold shock domain-containing protein [Acinetobacter sp. GD03645]MDH2203042.1 cold shock domain-containing protein [Acinetobacter sp. GD03647]
MKQEFYQGKIKQYNPDKGFGFIATAEGDVFFHISDYPASEGEPKRNEKVKFLVQENEGKFKAVKIECVDPNPAKTKKNKIMDHNKAITSELLSNFRR